MAANAEVLAESQDVLMNLILWAYQKRASTAVEPEEGKSRLTVQCINRCRSLHSYLFIGDLAQFCCIRLKVANCSTDLSVGYVLDIPVGIVICQHKTLALPHRKFPNPSALCLLSKQTWRFEGERFLEGRLGDENAARPGLNARNESFHLVSCRKAWFCKKSRRLKSVSSFRARARPSRISLTEHPRRREQSCSE